MRQKVIKWVILLVTLGVIYLSALSAINGNYTLAGLIFIPALALAGMVFSNLIAGYFQPLFNRLLDGPSAPTLASDESQLLAPIHNSSVRNRGQLMSDDIISREALYQLLTSYERPLLRTICFRLNLPPDFAAEYDVDAIATRLIANYEQRGQAGGINGLAQLANELITLDAAKIGKNGKLIRADAIE